MMIARLLTEDFQTLRLLVEFFVDSLPFRLINVPFVMGNDFRQIHFVFRELRLLCLPLFAHSDFIFV